MSDYVLAIDPGNVKSAYILMERKTLKPVQFGIEENEFLLGLICRLYEIHTPIGNHIDVVIEKVASYGMAVGETVFETVFWIGRFFEMSSSFRSRSRMYRMDVKMHLCHSSRAKDANIRQALIDRFGDVGTVKNPGWFFGFKADIWAAYALGVSFVETGN